MNYTAKDGSPKLVAECSRPLTGRTCVDRVINDLGVTDVLPEGLVLRKLAPGVSVDDIRAATQAPLQVTDDLALATS